MKHTASFNIGSDVRDALSRLAAQEDRSKSWLADHLLREGLQARSVLPVLPKPAQPERVSS